ncbi:hypothetical protein MKW92_053045, partial [Papaver armeniacum]
MEPTAISNGAPTTVPTSQTAEIATNVPTAQTAPKLRVEMDESGRLKGPNSQQFATLTGELVLAHCPVSFLDWRIVPRILKENVWNKLMEKVKAATEKRKKLIDEGLVDPMDIDNDEITEVFGPDKGKSGLLGYSSHTSKAQTLHANLATSVMAAKGAKMDEIELERTNQRITKVNLQQHIQHHQAIGEQQQNEHAAYNQPIPDVQRTTVQSPNHGSNTGLAGIVNPQDGVQFVHLFNRKRLTVAIGYVVYGKEGEICHTVQVLADERKICLKSIYD